MKIICKYYETGSHCTDVSVAGRVTKSILCRVDAFATKLTNSFPSLHYYVLQICVDEITRERGTTGSGKISHHEGESEWG